MRVSKPIEVRRQEIIQTSMKIFLVKGYELTTIRDIAKEMNVVPGLCYRYFPSKYELYKVATSQYAKACAAPMIQIFGEEGLTLEEYFTKLTKVMATHEGDEIYHDFYHKSGDEMLHQQLTMMIMDEIVPSATKLLMRLRDEGQIQGTDAGALAKFILYGQIPIMNDESRSMEERANKCVMLARQVLV